MRSVRLFPSKLLNNLFLFFTAVIVWGAASQAAAQAVSQDASFADRSTFRRPFFKELGSDFAYIFQDKDFYRVVGGLGLAPFIFKSGFDHESPEFTELWGPSQFADNFFELGEGMGNAVYPVAASMFLGAVGGLRKNSSLKAFGSDMVRAHLMNGLVTTAMKGLVDRTRPDNSAYSYPSGHTSTAFTTAGVIHHHYGWKWGLPSFVLASYVGLSRLQENKHYVTDIVAGAFIGTFISYKITNKHESTSRYSLMPAIVQGSPGVGITMSL